MGVFHTSITHNTKSETDREILPTLYYYTFDTFKLDTSCEKCHLHALRWLDSVFGSSIDLACFSIGAGLAD